MDWYTRIVGQHWPFYSHQRLYDFVKTEATGAGAVEPADQAWARFAELMDESVQDIQQALAEAGASWDGLASESMYASVAPLAQWADDASTAGGASGESVRQVADAFSYTANAMPEPVQVTSTANSTTEGWFTHLFGGQTDQDRQEREAQQAKQRAVELMEGYSRNLDSAVTSVGSFVPPQPVAVRVPPQNFGGGPIHHETASFPGPAGPARPGGSEGPPPLPRTNPPQLDPDPAGFPPGPAAGGPTKPDAAGPSEQPPITKPPVDPADKGPVSRPPLGGSGPVTGFPIDPRTGRPVGPVPGRPPESTVGRGPSGEPGRGGRPDMDDGRRAAGRGGLVGAGPLDGERAPASRGVTAGPRGAAGSPGAGMAPIGAGARREEDKEHYSPDFLREYHDEYWDGSPPLAPAVIGEEDKPPAGEGA